VETEKLTVTVESPYAGVLLRRIEPGSKVPVGEPIAVIGEPGEDAAAHRLYQPAPQEQPSIPSAEAAPIPPPVTQPPADSPPAPARAEAAAGRTGAPHYRSPGASPPALALTWPPSRGQGQTAGSPGRT